MSNLTVNSEQLPARQALVTAIDTAWHRLATAGTWWTGKERLAIVEQVRLARNCTLCKQRKAALSPYTVDGTHDAANETSADKPNTNSLSPDAIEAIHRIATDASRITENWVSQITSGSLSEAQYIEIVSIVATVTGLDTLDEALGRDIRTPPKPLAGQPTLHRPAGAVKDLAWVATLSAETVSDEDPNPFPLHGSINIHRAMSLVPQEVINFFDLDVELYLKDHEIRDFDQEFREISHAQIELIAGRASAINGCYY